MKPPKRPIRPALGRGLGALIPNRAPEPSNEDGAVATSAPAPASRREGLRTVAIEVAGNFLGDESNPRSYWAKGGGPTELNEAMVAGLRRGHDAHLVAARVGVGAEEASEDRALVGVAGALLRVTPSAPASTR